MRHLRLFLAAVSLWISEHTGGEKGQYLCVRIAERYGSDCAFCRIIGALLSEPHCQDQLSDWLRTRKH